MAQFYFMSFIQVLSSLNVDALFFCPLQQLGGDPQRWTDVYAVLKGASLSCYRRQEDVEASVEPAFTIAVNKVGPAGLPV